MEQEVARNIEEQLSAFLDGELPEEELALLVRRLERDEAYRSTLDRYALIGGVLRGEQAALPMADLRHRVMRSLDDSAYSSSETAPPAKSRSQSGYLVAASVAAGVVAVFLSGTLDEPQSRLQSPPQPQQLAASGSAVAPVLSAAVPVTRVSAVPESRQPSTDIRPATAQPAVTPAVQAVAAVTGSGEGGAGDVAALRARHQQELQRIRLNQERMRSYLISHGEYSRPLHGPLADSRMYIQQASFQD